VDFVATLCAEFDRRRAVNPRYSLRRFANALGTSHSALSRLGRGAHRPGPATIAALGPRLGLSPGEIASAIRRLQVDRLRDVAASPEFRADARWLATQANLSLDDVQVALQEALRTGRLRMAAAGRWDTEE
jgi:transcriptional regulator with XRE-family HTH domain